MTPIYEQLSAERGFDPLFYSRARLLEEITSVGPGTITIDGASIRAFASAISGVRVTTDRQALQGNVAVPRRRGRLMMRRNRPRHAL